MNKVQARAGLFTVLCLVGASMLNVPVAMANSKYAAIVVDGKTGKVLHAEKADAPRFPASLTKIMTLYVLFDYLTKNRLSRETKFYVTPYAASRPPTRMGLRAGQYVQVKHLIGALVTKSANDGAATIAENLAGTEANFARVMTLTARRIGMLNTVFKNASGLPNYQQRTTARDMAILGARLYKDFPRLSRAFKIKYYQYKRKSFRNHNRLLFTYKGTVGIKTGYTRASGFNLVTSVYRGNRHLIAVVMGGRSGARRNHRMAVLLNKYFPKAKSIKGRHIPQLFAGRSLSDHSVRIARFRPVTPAMRSGSAAVTNAAARPSDRKARVQQASLTDNPASVSQRGNGNNYSGRYKRPDLSRYVQEYDLQTGSFTVEDEANARIEAIKAQAGSLVRGHAPFTMKFEKDGVTYYRARFADFSRNDARKRCNRLKRQGFPCLAMRAE